MTTHSDLSLDGIWDFAFLGRIDFEQWRPEAFAAAEKTVVPSAFDALPAHAGERGAGAYRRVFAVPAGHPAQLRFGAVSMRSRVFVDGQLLHESACGYAPFWVDLPPSQHEERELVVLADNRFDFEHVPMHEAYFDFYQYGGVLREVMLRLLPKTGPSIDHVQVIPGKAYASGEVTVRVRFGGECPAVVAVTLSFNGGAQEVMQVQVSDGAAEFAVKVPEPRVWSPETPHLHRLAVGLEDPLAAREVRFGLRRIEAREGCLWLNGAKLILRGVNRHEWHPTCGPATSPLQMLADLQLMKKMGCNCVRGSHYPQSQRFLDLCDELGMLVWEENLGWGQREKTFASEKFRRDHATALRAMVKASCNHPSVIFWGFLNEAGTNGDYVRPVFEETVSALRALDPSRLITYATMFAFEDKHFDLADVISINTYPGWYGCENEERPLDTIEPRLRECLESVDRRGFRDKPVIFSEIGAEALYGWHDPHNDFFSEEYQAEYLRTACRAALGNSRCSGILLWHFSDVRTYSGGRSLGRPRTFNNKGLLDEYRRPKASFRAVKSCFAPE